MSQESSEEGNHLFPVKEVETYTRLQQKHFLYQSKRLLVAFFSCKKGLKEKKKSKSCLTVYALKVLPNKRNSQFQRE